ARSGAVDELMASGALEDMSTSGDPLQAELDRVATGSGVDRELERLKAELGPSQSKSLDSGSSTDADDK
ncbi:MAG TPA: PspA/IM30 family protein, partial [Actinomycetota bacterium]|nr:PspA/IM30 family protein [Actinomycetota bacterium]